MNGKKLGGLLAAAALLCLTGCSLLGMGVSTAERELLCQFRDSRRFVVSGEQYWEETDPEWDLYLLRLDDQVSRPEEIRFEFTEDIEREVFALNSNYEIVWKRTFSGGAHSIPVSESVMGIAFPLRDGEAFHPTGTGMHPRLETPLAGRKLSILGDSVSAFAGFIPWEDYSYYSSSNFGASSMWWAVLAENTGMEICNVNAVSGSGVIVPEDAADYNRPLTGNSVRCENLSSRDGEAPDEILILLSGNDYLKQVSTSRIKREYLEMLSRVKAAYPNANIHICTYFQNKAMPSVMLEELNGLLRGIAEEAGVDLIDLENCGILEGEPEKYMIDANLHPNERGQILMGVCAAQQMLESETGE